MTNRQFVAQLEALAMLVARCATIEEAVEVIRDVQAKAEEKE